MTTLEAIVMKEHDKDKISSQYSNIFYRLDQENMLERNCKPGWVWSDYPIEAVEANDNISGMLLQQEICTVRLSKSYGIISIA
jgi:hypothetical protein